MRVLFFSLLLLSSSALAAIKTEVIQYSDGATALEGVLYYQDTAKNKLPAVIVVHEWMGLDDYAKRRAQQVAELGYVAFAADIYGKGVRAKNTKEAGELSGKFKGDRTLLKSRMRAAYDVVTKNDRVNTKKIAVMGYCFGGTAALELARSGADLIGTVSFHGGLDSPKPEEAKNIKGKVLALHGALDSFVPEKDVLQFMKEMNEAKVDYQFVTYSGAVHGFTNPKNGSDPSKGVAYHPDADRRSWRAMKNFFEEVSQ